MNHDKSTYQRKLEKIQNNSISGLPYMHEHDGWICTNNSKSTIDVYIWPDRRSLHKLVPASDKEAAREAQIT